MADLEAQVRATLADRAGRLEGPLPYAAPPALVDAVATRAAQLHRRRTLVRVGGAAAAVAVIGLAAATLVRGPSVAGPLGPAGSVTAAATRTVDSGTATAAATRTVDSGTSGDTSAQAAAEDRIIRAALAADPAFPAGWDPQSQAVFGCGFYRVGVSVSPVIPFLNEPELERILQAARNAGASRAFSIVLRLPWEVSPLFQQWLQQQLPERAERIMARVREMRGGKDNDSRFGTRMTGQGVWAQLLRQRFDKACARLGYQRERAELDVSRFRPPARQAGQGQLF